MELREEDVCVNTSLYKCLVRCNAYKIICLSIELVLLPNDHAFYIHYLGTETHCIAGILNFFMYV